MVARQRLGIEPQVGDRFRMRSRRQMEPDAVLALAYAPLNLQIPPGVVVQVVARSVDRVHVRQYHAGQLYGAVISYNPMLFEAWFRPER